MAAFSRKSPKISVAKGRHMFLLSQYFSDPHTPLSHVYTCVLVNLALNNANHQSTYTHRFSSQMSTLTSLHLLAVLRHIVRPYWSEKFDVFITVVLGHFLSSSFVGSLITRTIFRNDQCSVKSANDWLKQTTLKKSNLLWKQKSETDSSAVLQKARTQFD